MRTRLPLERLGTAPPPWSRQTFWTPLDDVDEGVNVRRLSRPGTVGDTWQSVASNNLPPAVRPDRWKFLAWTALPAPLLAGLYPDQAFFKAIIAVAIACSQCAFSLATAEVHTFEGSRATDAPNALREGGERVTTVGRRRGKGSARRRRQRTKGSLVRSRRVMDTHTLRGASRPHRRSPRPAAAAAHHNPTEQNKQTVQHRARGRGGLAEGAHGRDRRLLREPGHEVGRDPPVHVRAVRPLGGGVRRGRRDQPGRLRLLARDRRPRRRRRERLQGARRDRRRGRRDRCDRGKTRVPQPPKER